MLLSVARCNTLQHAATHCNTLQHAATRCNTLQHTATHCNTLQHTATHCNTLQHIATHCNTLQTHFKHTATLCTTLQHIAPQCFPESQPCAPRIFSKGKLLLDLLLRMAVVLTFEKSCQSEVTKIETLRIQEESRHQEVGVCVCPKKDKRRARGGSRDQNTQICRGQMKLGEP